MVETSTPAFKSQMVADQQSRDSRTTSVCQIVGFGCDLELKFLFND